MPALSILIGGTSAVTVILVAAVTLSITLSFSLSAIDKVARDQTTSLANLAGVKLDAYFSQPRDSARAIAERFRAGDHPLPTETANGMAAADATADNTMTAYRSAPDAASCFVVLRDGTYMQAQRNPRSPAHLFIHRHYHTSPGNIDVRAWSYYAENGTASPPGFESGLVAPTNLLPLWTASGRLHLMDVNILANEQRNQIFVGPPVALQFGTAQPFLQLSVYGAAYNASNTSLGIVGCGAGATLLQSFLAESKATEGTELFVIGPDDRILSSTHRTPFFDVYENVNRSRPAEPGCASTIGTTAAAPGRAVHWMCRYLFADHPYAPAGALAAAGIPTVDSVEKMVLAGETYYVAVRLSQMSGVFGYLAKLVLFIPEKDIVGEVREGMGIAIGVSCAVLVLAVAASFAAVVALLKPLQAVSERMQRAAAFEDDDADRSVSAISEVRELQESYYALNDELTRVSAFVPATVLANRYADADAMDLGDIDTSDAKEESDLDRYTVRSSHHSRGRKSAARSSQNTGSKHLSGKASSGKLGGGASALNVALGLTERNCTVLVANCANFGSLARTTTADSLSRLYGDYIQKVYESVQQYHGVLDAFHGDHLLATFNGARPIVQHCRRGTLAAISVAAVAVPTSLNLPVFIGVGTGRCRVGNVGCSAMKRFNVIGSCVKRASDLCNMGAAYATDGSATLNANEDQAALTPTAIMNKLHEVPHGSAVLIAGASVIEESQVHFRLRFVDVRSFGGGDAPVAAVLSEVPEGKQDEWLYVVGQGQDATTPGGMLEAAFRLATMQPATGTQTAAAAAEPKEQAKAMLERAEKAFAEAGQAAPSSLGRLRAYLAKADGKRAAEASSSTPQPTAASNHDTEQHPNAPTAGQDA